MLLMRNKWMDIYKNRRRVFNNYICLDVSQWITKVNRQRERQRWSQHQGLLSACVT